MNSLAVNSSSETRTTFWDAKAVELNECVVFLWGPTATEGLTARERFVLFLGAQTPYRLGGCANREAITEMWEPLTDAGPSRFPSERISVIVPTLNEVQNVDALLAAILSPSNANLDLEILIADGGSTDGTVERVQFHEATSPVRLVEGGGDRGLAGDVLNAAQHAAAIVVVMDGDLSHPAASIPELVAPIIQGDSDIVIGSRYVRGGSTPSWPVPRRLLSRLGAMLAWPICDVRDPMSGFFAVRRDRLLAVDPNAAGFKIGMEIMAAGGDNLRVSEVPITFTDRTYGTSKINLLQMATFVRRLMVLAGGSVSTGSAVRFAAVGLIGLIVDFTAFMTLLASGSSISAAHVTSFVLASAFNYALNSQWSFAGAPPAQGQSGVLQYLRFLTVCVMALFLRGGVLVTALDAWAWTPTAAILLAIASGTVVNYLGSAFFVFPAARCHASPGTRWRIAALGIVGYVILMRLIFGGTLISCPKRPITGTIPNISTLVISIIRLWSPGSFGLAPKLAAIPNLRSASAPSCVGSRQPFSPLD